jgi:predicted porin
MNIRKETEVHFTGETTLDSGLTVGVHIEADVDADENFAGDEAYMYLSGGWGRINFGEEDGVAYLLQVAAPSADSNVDGLRQYISTYNLTGGNFGGIPATETTTLGAFSVAGDNFRLDYDHAVAGGANKLSYMTPVFNGFQAGVSYIPTVSDTANGFTATDSDNDSTEYGDAYEVAARYEGAFEGVGIAFGAGYGHYSNEDDALTGGTDITDDRKTWNVGADLDFAGFGLGVAYLSDDIEVERTIDVDNDTWVVGADYQMGAYKLGASWLNTELDSNQAGSDEIDIDRFTGGVSYAYGPGMSFRGSVSVIDGDDEFADSTQVMLGTQVNF